MLFLVSVTSNKEKNVMRLGKVNFSSYEISAQL